MKDQIKQIVQEKILSGMQRHLPAFTRRDVRIPLISGKAMTVIGMRRAGKTTFLHQVRSDRIREGAAPESLVYFNFEDERLAGFQAEDLHRILSVHQRLYALPEDVRSTFFLDEIQLVPGWESFTRRLLDEDGCDLFLSGSSALLLSREIASSMRGRGWEINIQPFSFRESLRHRNLDIPGTPHRLTAREQASFDRYFREYLEAGGFPEAQGLETIDRRQLLQGYVDSLLLRDVIERHRVTNPTALRWMTRRLLGNPGGLFSVTKFEADLKSQGIAVGRESLYQFLGHLEDAFLLNAIPVATDSEKRRQVNPRKIYPADPAIGPVFDRSAKANLGHALEVAVQNELSRQGAETAYVKTPEGFEVDFLSRNADGTQWLIQAAVHVDDAETLGRECRALIAAKQFFAADRLLLLTGESRMPMPAVPKGIEVIPAWQWMLSHP
ncbi:MAG: ATP-binding protein [Verrucomicrobia bacterium]|nr:ATP-binding protein [Verrucomicrobiota bacterium]MCH8512221.1 ATP-binding protein [Kiritimatiellia bacterium]